MGTTQSPPIDFNFNDHLHSHFLVALSSRATTKNKRNTSKLNEGRKDDVSIYKIFGIIIIL